MPTVWSCRLIATVMSSHVKTPLTGVGSSAAACSRMATAGLKDAHSCLCSSSGCGVSAAVAAALLEEGGCEPDLAIAAGSGGVCLHAYKEPQNETFKNMIH